LVPIPTPGTGTPTPVPIRAPAPTALSVSQRRACASPSVVVTVAFVTSRTIIVPGPCGWKRRWHAPSSILSLPSPLVLLATPQSVLLPLLGFPFLFLSSPFLPVLLLLPLSFSPLNNPLPFVFFLFFAVKSLALNVTWAPSSEGSSHAVQFDLLCGGQTVCVMSFKGFRIRRECLEVREKFCRSASTCFSISSSSTPSSSSFNCSSKHCTSTFRFLSCSRISASGSRCFGGATSQALALSCALCCERRADMFRTT